MGHRDKWRENESKCNGNTKTNTQGGRPGPTEEGHPLSQLEKESAKKSRKEDKLRGENIVSIHRQKHNSRRSKGNY